MEIKEVIIQTCQRTYLLLPKNLSYDTGYVSLRIKS